MNMGRILPVGIGVASTLPEAPRRRLRPAAGLFFLAPLIGEFLLGNLAITWLWVLPVLAPLYGAGALLIREAARRLGLGWPAIVCLGLAFGVVEEAFVTRSLFNPDYLGFRLLDFGYLPSLGIGSWWTVFVLGLHTVWSTAVPIALVESLASGPRRAPWLGPLGLGLTAVGFLGGCLLVARLQEPAAFDGSAAQLTVSAVVVAALVAIAVTAGRGRGDGPADAHEPGPAAPPPLFVGAAALACGSGFMIVATKVIDAIPAPANVLAMLTWLGLVGFAARSWSRRAGWSERHRLALAGGLLLTYTWHAFTQAPSVGKVSPRVDLLGDVVFAGAAVLLLALAARAAAREGAGS
jgi:hypothetical protein